MKRIKEIPAEIDEIMHYFAKVFADSMRDPTQDKEDLYHDLVVLYLETLQTPKRGLNPENKNHWFMFFKSNLINRYTRALNARKMLVKVTKDVAAYYENIKD